MNSKIAYITYFLSDLYLDSIFREIVHPTLYLLFIAMDIALDLFHFWFRKLLHGRFDRSDLGGAFLAEAAIPSLEALEGFRPQ